LASHDVPIGATQVSLAQLNERSREIFRQIVESYLATVSRSARATSRA
jgi:heat-inducible transcriptional repressor